jgi:hypothetical protein
VRTIRLPIGDARIFARRKRGLVLARQRHELMLDET